MVKIGEKLLSVISKLIKVGRSCKNGWKVSKRSIKVD